MGDLETILTTLRSQGWSVAVHNDYRLNNTNHTFWLLTHTSGRWVKGEAVTDREALNDCLRQADSPQPPVIAGKGE